LGYASCGWILDGAVVRFLCVTCWYFLPVGELCVDGFINFCRSCVNVHHTAFYCEGAVLSFVEMHHKSSWIWALFLWELCWDVCIATGGALWRFVTLRQRACLSCTYGKWVAVYSCI
jgi:hypothetical protein